MTEHIVEAKCGRIKGYQEKGVYIYRGIPYAKTERFELPKPYVWEGEFDATVGETDCCQFGTFVDESKAPSFYYEEFRSGMKFSSAEDFMTLNVFDTVLVIKLFICNQFIAGKKEVCTCKRQILN